MASLNRVLNLPFLRIVVVCLPIFVVERRVFEDFDVTGDITTRRTTLIYRIIQTVFSAPITHGLPFHEAHILVVETLLAYFSKWWLDSSHLLAVTVPGINAISAFNGAAALQAYRR